jgi:tetratricopeptide (TPR) repeat protein
MMRLNPRFCALTLAALLPLAHAVPDAEGNLVSPAPDISEDAAMSARLNYNLGFEKYEKTLLLEAGSPAAPAVKEGYGEARDRFRKAVVADPKQKEGWNMLGFTSRKLGEYEESLSAYEAALKLQPEYPEAIEYRAELFLLTGRLDDAKTSFGQLVKTSPSYAKVLLQSMRDWVAAAAKGNPPGKSGTVVSAAQREAFASWVAAQTVAP